jgi:hypothetical protein
MTDDSSSPTRAGSEPPDESGDWILLIVDSFGPEGATTRWVRKTDSSIHRWPPTDAS